MIELPTLWRSTNELHWTAALETYWGYVRPENMKLERDLNDLNLERIVSLDPMGWYDFLLQEYFRWKYTAPNRYATTTSKLRKYEETNQLDILFDIKKRLLTFDLADISTGLSIAREIRGPGIAGASGLLSLMYPHHFGTVDQFAVKALCQVPYLPQITDIRKMNPDSITLKEGIILINIMRRKAKENNLTFKTDFWTPRKIDMILWASRPA